MGEGLKKQGQRWSVASKREMTPQLLHSGFLEAIPLKLRYARSTIILDPRIAYLKKILLCR
jgi:hypothetical protein